MEWWAKVVYWVQLLFCMMKRDLEMVMAAKHCEGSQHHQTVHLKMGMMLIFMFLFYHSLNKQLKIIKKRENEHLALDTGNRQSTKVS